MQPVATYVFIDLETTGFPSQETNRTKITELSMVAVKRDHVLVTRVGAAPRVQNKLTLCLNPRKMIFPESTDVTGLCNDLLEHEADFNMNVFTLINTFLNVLTKPVCLVAQNGLYFDYPILKRHVENLKVSLSEDLLCADCYHGFYDILEERKKTEICVGHSKFDETIGSEVSSNKNEINGNETVINLNKDKIIEDETVTMLQKDQTVHNVTVTNFNKDLIDGNNKVVDRCKIEIHSTDLYMLENTLIMKSINEVTPIKRSKFANEKINKAKRRFPWSEGSKPKESFKLKNIYERLLNRPAVEAHRAENDCILALECAVALGKDFVEWIDYNHVRFSDIRPMTIGVPLGM